MTVLTWAIRLIIFSFLVVFAVQNTDPVNLHFLLGQVWQAPLVIVLLAFFSGGAVLGALSVVGVIYRQRREINRLKRAAHDVQPVAVLEQPPAA
jgi:uncharacterized integral membrane protein